MCNRVTQEIQTLMHNSPASQAPLSDALPETARGWNQLLSKYRDPNSGRSIFELLISIVPFLLIAAAAWWALSFSYWLTLGLSMANGLFLVRLFAIQHDCGHRSFFRQKALGDWIGRGLGILTLTPYDVWRRTHSLHHATSGNLGKRGIGDVQTLTVAEYRARGRWGRLAYRIYRNPVVLFGFGPIYLFYFQNRLPIGLMRAGWRYWTSSMTTNAAIALGLGLMLWFGGIAPILLIFLPTTLMGAALGLWLFYVQHQFENTYWETGDEWCLHDAALRGSSHYALPAVLQWMTANIGIHHVHHLYSRIPFYRLVEVLRDHPALQNAQRMTIRQSLASVRLRLWDERSHRLLTHAEARALYR